MIRFLTAFAVCLFTCNLGLASVPALLNYQGELRDQVGETVPDGNYSVTFRIWDSETDGTALWQEGRLVEVKNGLFAVLLGSIVPIPDSLFETSDRWIGLQVGLDPEMSPRQQLVSVPFAWHSMTADQSDTAKVARTVDTTGYSAYQDLLSEGRIGEQSNQVATGDHSHPQGSIQTFSHYFTDSVWITQSNGEVTVKSLPLPLTDSPTYLRILVMCNKVVNGTSVELRMRLNGQEVYSYGAGGEGNAMLGTMIMWDQDAGLWLSRPDYTVFWCYLGLASSNLNPPITLEITAESSSSTPSKVVSSRVFVEYSVE